MEGDRKFVECFENKSSFQWTFSLPISSKNWKSKILDIDKEFLMKGKKYGLFYFENDISCDYQEVRKQRFFNRERGILELLGFHNYFPSQEEKHIGDMFLDVPKYVADGVINQPERIRKEWPQTNLRILELNTIAGVYLDDVENLSYGMEEVVYFTLYSSSNIWWEEISFIESNEGKIYKLELPINNRALSYRITPRLNSFLRDLRAKTIELGGSILLEEYDKRYVTEEGIILDGKVVYQEDLESGRISLDFYDSYPA